MAEYPKYEKVDNDTIKRIEERASTINIQNLLKGKQDLLAKKNEIEKTLKKVDDILENAEKLDISIKLRPSKPAKGKPTSNEKKN